MRFHVLVVLLVALACQSSVTIAQRLEARGADWEISEREWEQLAEKWKSEGRPMIAVLISVPLPSLDAKLRRPSRSTGQDANIELLAAEMRSLLAGRLGAGSIMKTESLSALQQRTAERIVLAAGNVDKKLVEEVRKSIDADIVFMIRLTESGGLLNPIMEVLDSRNGAVLASPTADPIDPNQSRWQNIYASALLKEFIKAYAAENRPPPVYYFDLYITGFEKFSDADTVFDIVDDELSERGSTHIDDDVVTVGEANFASILRIAYEGDRPGRVLRRVSRALDREFESEYIIQPVERTRFRLSAYAYRDRMPVWYAKTEPGLPSFSAEVSTRMDRIRTIAGGLRLGILVGRGIAEDWPQLEIQGVPDDGAGMPYPPADLRTALQDQFTLLGFDVRDDAATRDRIQQLARQMDRRGVSALTVEALADADFFDLLAVVALRTYGDGGVKVNARLISRADAKLLGGLVGPSLAETRPGAYQVRDDQVEVFARYIAGTLASRFDAQASQLGRTVDVTVLNMQSGAQFDAIRTLLAGTPGIERVGRSALSMPAGTLEIVTSSQVISDLVSRVERQLPRLSFTPVIAGSSATSLVIDVNPSVNTAPPRDEDLVARIEAYPEDFPPYIYEEPPEALEGVEPQVEGLEIGNSTTTPAASPPLNLDVGPRTPIARPNAWALLIGVNKAEGQSPLRGCVNDAKHLASALVSHAGFPPEHVILMTDEQAGTELDPTSENIMNAVKLITEALGNNGGTQSNAQVVFFFSSHGRADEEAGITALVARDGKSVVLEVIRNQFTVAGVGESVFIIDACQSGGPNDLAFSRSLQVADQTTLAACRWDETSIETGNPPRGLFTTAVVAGLTNGAADRQAGDGDGILDLFELYKYTYRVVRYKRNGEQNPFLKLQTGSIPVFARYE